MKRRELRLSVPSTGEEEWLAVREPIVSGWLTSGKYVQDFEHLFAERHSVNEAIAVSNCTCALHLALLSLGVTEADEVVVPAFTWLSSANAVLYCGAKVVFADIDLQTFNVCPSSVSEVVTDRTKVIMPVHLFGLCADVHAIRRKCPDLAIVEDAACAVGARNCNSFAGGLGDVGCFSFHPRKTITTGEGGMLTTNNDHIAESLRSLRNLGATPPSRVASQPPPAFEIHDYDRLGYNYRMTDIQAAIGIVQLGKLGQLIEARSKSANYLTALLGDFNWIRCPQCPANFVHSWQAYVILVDHDLSPKSRNEIMFFLQQRGIGTRPGTQAVHMVDYFRQTFGYSPEDFPNSRSAYECSLALPMHAELTEGDADYIASCLRELHESS